MFVAMTPAESFIRAANYKYAQENESSKMSSVFNFVQYINTYIPVQVL